MKPDCWRRRAADGGPVAIHRGRPLDCELHASVAMGTDGDLRSRLSVARIHRPQTRSRDSIQDVGAAMGTVNTNSAMPHELASRRLNSMEELGSPSRWGIRKEKTECTEFVSSSASKVPWLVEAPIAQRTSLDPLRYPMIVFACHQGPYLQLQVRLSKCSGSGKALCLCSS